MQPPTKYTRTTKDGTEGILRNTKAIVTLSSGGAPVGSEMDFLTLHLKLFLGFTGITDVTIIPAKDII